MKNHIAFKFLAIALCAACLLSAVCSGAGILVLAEANLSDTDYRESCLQVLESRAQQFAQTQMVFHAEQSQEDFPNQIDFTEDGLLYGPYRPFPVNSYNYQILDKDGSVLVDQTGSALSDPIAYTFPASGSYRKVVSIEPVEEVESQPEEPGAFSVTDNIPTGETVAVYGMSLGYESSSGGMESPEPIGLICHTPEGTALYSALTTDNILEDMGSDTLPTGITFYDQEQNVIYSISCSTGVDGLSIVDGLLQFESPVIFQTTEVMVAADLLPIGKNVVVAGIRVGWDGSSTEMDFYELGYLCRYDDGSVSFTASSFDSFEETPGDPVTHVTFLDQDGDVLYSATNPDGVGRFFHNAWSTYCFMSTVPATADEPAQTGSVNGYINAYAEPSLTASVLSSLSAGFPVEISRTVTESGVEWGYIQDIGWVMMDQITLSAGQPAQQSEEEAETVPETTVPLATAVTEPVQIDSTESTEPTGATETADEPLPRSTDAEIRTLDYWDSDSQQTMRLFYTMEPMPEYTCVVYLEWELRTYFPEYDIVSLLFAHQDSLVRILAVSIALFAVLAVYLCCVAGKKPGDSTVRPGGFNLLPLDLYLAGGTGLGVGLGALAVFAASELLSHDWQVACGFALGMGYGICLIFVGFCFACAAQFKTSGGYWWRNLLTLRCCKLFFALCRWSWRTGIRLVTGSVPLTRRFLRWCGKCLLWCWLLVRRLWRWLWGLVKACFRKLHAACNRLISLLPLMWQWILAGCAMFLLLVVAQTASSDLLTLLCLAGCAGIVLYGAHCFGILADSAKRMSKGDLDIQVEDPWMIGSFQDFAQDLNGLAGVAVVAAQKQLKSERMKTELITNVSHDIKTPLTSIINYVDLLQKPHTPQQEQQYLEVLDRQSQRLKKLIEDLIEMSKASTGNMAVDIRPLDAVETVNQALGEFADKLEKAQLIPVFRRPEEPVTMLADGRLAWRVLSNLLSNAVKYALPGTRLYVDLIQVEGKVILSLKNISRDELTTDADELMERFVRGDSSRNTEGSGLGLNIAKSLMDLQKCQLQLLVDGDLFKVTLIFPGA